MEKEDALRRLLLEFFELPEETPVQDLSQTAMPKWDSLAMVQLITELQEAFGVEFDLDEIERLRSHAEIRDALIRKGAAL